MARAAAAARISVCVRAPTTAAVTAGRVVPWWVAPSGTSWPAGSPELNIPAATTSTPGTQLEQLRRLLQQRVAAREQ
ncbi:hypothetical protein [Amycolatopsis sp. MtRt-6]|uniref:hypothetical protein n=1 Tax=Amycolatopsis sp. MtRt-6 TaxID=2792782 RepID=UPI001A8E5AEA|nr:hypothetical protein [Amycolatopsis sp. MtRt-6]